MRLELAELAGRTYGNLEDDVRHKEGEGDDRVPVALVGAELPVHVHLVALARERKVGPVDEGHAVHGRENRNEAPVDLAHGLLDELGVEALVDGGAGAVVMRPGVARVRALALDVGILDVLGLVALVGVKLVDLLCRHSGDCGCPSFACWLL